MQNIQQKIENKKRRKQTSKKPENDDKYTNKN